MQRTRYTRAFTLVELMVGMMVTSIILSAVATLAFALSSASTAGGDNAFTQAQVRHATLHLSELIGKCRLICAAPGDDLVVWKADGDNNGQINLHELVYIERGADRRLLRLCQFSSADNPECALDVLALPATKAQLLAGYEVRYTDLIPECNDVQFALLGVAPPATELLAITFGIVEDRVSHRYEIVAAVRARASHLLNAAGSSLVAGDDD